MKKCFIIEDLDCANCAAKLEDGLRKVEGIQDVSVNFISQKLTVEAEDAQFDDVIKRVIKAAKKIEPDCCIIVR